MDADCKNNHAYIFVISVGITVSNYKCYMIGIIVH